MLRCSRATTIIATKRWRAPTGSCASMSSARWHVRRTMIARRSPLPPSARVSATRRVSRLPVARAGCSARAIRPCEAPAARAAVSAMIVAATSAARTVRACARRLERLRRQRERDGPAGLSGVPLDDGGRAVSLRARRLARSHARSAVTCATGKRPGTSVVRSTRKPVRSSKRTRSCADQRSTFGKPVSLSSRETT